MFMKDLLSCHGRSAEGSDYTFGVKILKNQLSKECWR